MSKYFRVRDKITGEWVSGMGRDEALTSPDIEEALTFEAAREAWEGYLNFETINVDLISEVERLQSALAALRAAAQVVIEQVDRDAAIGLGRSQFSRLDLYEVVLTSEQVEALRVALAEGGEG